MRTSLFALLASLFLTSTSQAAEFRCFGAFTENGRLADLLFYGEIEATTTQDLRVEFVGDNGFYAVNSLEAKAALWAPGKSLGFLGQAANDGEASFQVETVYNPPVGNYLGTVTARRGERAMPYPVRCVILKGI